MTGIRTHDEFCFNTDLYQDDVEGYMCICNRLDSARHQERIDQRDRIRKAVKALPWHRPWGSDDSYEYLVGEEVLAAIDGEENP